MTCYEETTSFIKLSLHHLNRKFKTGLILITAASIFAGIVYIIIWDIRMSANKKNRIAIQGYDTVAFFKEGKAVKGHPEYEYKWNETTWRFSKTQYRDLFIADPALFAPQYGSNCAFTTSLGKAQRGLAKYWQIRDNKLYLNANLVSHFLWKRFPNRIKVAEKHWRRLTGRSRE